MRIMPEQKRNFMPEKPIICQESESIWSDSMWEMHKQSSRNGRNLGCSRKMCSYYLWENSVIVKTIVVIEAMKQLVQKHSQLRYFICGQGEKKQELQQLIRKYHLEDHVKLLGFRTDVAELCQAADVFVFPSKQEGLPVALMEAMACGVPVVCSRIRGNTDLVEDEKCLFMSDKAEQLERCIELKLKRKEKRKVYHKLWEYDLTNVLKKYGEIYAEK